MSIGIFDSGFGGLTVLKELIHHFPEESFVYLGDSARLPYGTKSISTIRRYLEQNIAFLLSQNVDAIIVACNSASSVLKEQEEFPVPVYGVIKPGAQAAIKASKNKKIGVVGTRATIQGGAYAHAIQQIDEKAEVFQQACPLLVPLVEEGLEDDPLSNLIVFRYLSPMQNTGIDTLILGCTHYPVLKKAFKKVLGHSVELVDSAVAISQQIKSDMQKGIFHSRKDEDATLQIFATDTGSSFQMVAEKILAPMKCPLIHGVDLSQVQPFSSK